MVRRDDLVQHGLTRNAVASRLRSGRLTRLHDRVYAFGHTALRDEGLWPAALWACGPDAALSHTTAGAYHRAMPVPPAGAAVHVTTTREVRSRPGIVVHRVTRLERVDLFRPHPLAVTTMPRTLVDLADVLPWDEYRAVADGLRELPVRQVREAQRRARGRRAPRRSGA